MISSNLRDEQIAVAQIIVRDLDEDVKLRLQRRARRHGRSMEDEIRHILRDAAKLPPRPVAGLGTRIAELFREAEFSLEVPELRGTAAQAPEFAE